ncbi:glycerol-3-phosphate 1-O-acyltransferase PlsY [Hymenobacter nivis]|uniref:Glycerol-3-phosphate acyltransferase n=1 Tax=Hymenobacter nivis TaxID=1850093 RepID=A0A2Z3GUC2_9BACT|nr:glycerol-3-phosphate 1-O-acyltransferase PlsY [Hymenobacter nivis]AWM34605.1 acyl-phosphate glycerol 3-phosphate acyltransferase [Hymenobacter nivis]
MNIPLLLLALLAAYLLGSIPTALWVGRRFFGLADIRQHGSGNAGATNTFRVLGKKAGSAVMAIDVLKGYVATALPAWLAVAPAGSGPLLYAQLGAGALAVVGHIYPVWAQFRGGKGVATIVGMMLAIAPATVGVCILVFLAMLALFRYVSLASMTAGLAFALLQLLPMKPFKPDQSFMLGVGFAIAILLVYTHRANIGRLRAGTESRVPMPWAR